MSEARTTHAYRSLDGVLRDLLERARERHDGEWEGREAARRVVVWRIGRAVGGATGLAFGLSAFVCALLGQRHRLDGYAFLEEWATWLLLMAWPAAFVAGALARLATARPMSRRVHAAVALTGHAGTDLVRLQTIDTLGDARALAARWERAGAALPLAALSIVTPLTLHFLVWALGGWALAGAGPRLALERACDFGEWIGMSAMIVGHAHLALAACAVWWACSLRKCETIALRGRLSGGVFTAIAITVGVACLPGLFLLGIPPLLVAVTGAVFIGPMYAFTLSLLRRERLALQ